MASQELTALAHVVEHHENERRALPYVVALLAKVAAAHRARNPKLSALCDAGQELADALEAHADEEEHGLLPAVAMGVAAEGGATDRRRRSHGGLALLLERVRWLADDFAVPSWGGQSYQALMEELESLEDNVLEDVHLEQYALVPRLATPPGGEG